LDHAHPGVPSLPQPFPPDPRDPILRPTKGLAVQRVYFCTGTSFLTGDDVADAVLEYAWVLAQYGRHDLVRVPTLHPDGSAGRSTLLIGPMSQISSEDVVAAGDDL